MKKMLLCLILLSPACLARSDWFPANSLQAFHPNYVSVASDHGENRVQFLLSLEYEALSFKNLDWKLAGYRVEGVNLGYDGLYDFFLWTRHSQPLVSRLQDAGLFLSLKAPEKSMDSLDLGWFHESNGQITDTASEYAAIAASQGEQAASDSVSRGWDYWYLSSNFHVDPATNWRLNFKPVLRIYTGRQGIVLPAEQNVFWKVQQIQPLISDYDGLRAQLSSEWLFPDRLFSYLSLNLDLRTGYNGRAFAQNWSEVYSLTVKCWQVPLYVFYHNGYGAYISDYSSFSEGYGVGIRLW